MPVGYLSRRGLCLADPVLSQRSPSPQSVASVPVCYLSDHVSAVANHCFSAVVVPGSRRRAILGCAAVGAEFAVPGVASGSGVPGEWLLFGGLVVGVCHFCMLYLVYLTGLPMFLSVPASCHCDRCFCYSPHALRSAYLRSHASNGCCTCLCVPAPVRGVFLRAQAECVACCLLIGACFVL
jgi:hypothetical protein